MIKDFSIFCEGVNDNFLYHSAKYEYAIEAIRNNKMLAKTFHFFYRSDTRKLSMQDRINHARKLYGNQLQEVVKLILVLLSLCLIKIN